jgi:hypothetical protein
MISIRRGTMRSWLKAKHFADLSKRQTLMIGMKRLVPG